MAIEVFNRYEYKYKIHKYTAKMLMNIFDQQLNIDNYCAKHGFYQISNIYIDNKDHELISHSVSKPKYKHKFRIRTYQTELEENQMVYFEVKKKYDGLVNKRRCPMTYKQCKQLLRDKDANFTDEYINPQIFKEIKYLLNEDHYYEDTQIMYKRIAYFDDNKDLRISFDYDIQSSDYTLLRDDYMLMEIKTHLAMPLWLTEILDKYEIRKQSFSKYGAHYFKTIEEQYESVSN